MASSSTKIKAKESYCLSHNRNLPIDKFYKSKNPNHANCVLPYCQTCCNKMVYDKLKKTGNLESAMWLTCAEIGVPFFADVFTSLEATSKGSQRAEIGTYNYVGNYLSILQKKYGNKLKEWSFDDTDVPLGEIKTLRQQEATVEEKMEEFRLLWGNDYDVDELGYLEWRYDTYTSGKALTEYQASRYRDLCICELIINKDPSNKDALKMKATIAHELGEDQFVIDKEKSDIEKIIEYDIFIHEKHDPAEFYEDKEIFKDYIGIESYWKKYIARPIRNLILGDKNYNVNEDSKYGD